MRRSAFTLFATGCSIAVPSLAMAADGSTEAVSWGIGIVTLLASVALLLIALGLARVATGSAMAENISYVVAACVCLAGAVLASWSMRLVADPTVAEQIGLGGAALDTVGIVLFCIYFYRVRAALKRFLVALSGQDVMARAEVPEELGEVSAGNEAGGGAQ